MVSGIIPYNSIPGWPSPAAGLFESCQTALQAAGFAAVVSRAPEGLRVSDVTTVTNAMSAYSGSATELAYIKSVKQAALDTAFDANFDLAKFIRGGTSTVVTSAAVGSFLATITNNYRSLRASIAGAANVAAVNAINLNSGWPANP